MVTVLPPNYYFQLINAFFEMEPLAQMMLIFSFVLIVLFTIIATAIVVKRGKTL